MAKKGKRLSGAYEGIDRDAFYGLDDAVKMLKENARRSSTRRSSCR